MTKYASRWAHRADDVADVFSGPRIGDKSRLRAADTAVNGIVIIAPRFANLGTNVGGAGATDMSILTGSDGDNIFGGEGEKIGFLGATPVAQQAAPASLTDNSGGATDDTIAAVSGTGDDATINDNFAELAEEVNQIRTVLVNLGLAS